MKMTSGLAIYRSGHTLVAGDNAEADPLDELRRQVKDLARQIRDLWDQARRAGLVEDEAEDDPPQVVNEDLGIRLIPAIGDRPAVLGQLDGSGPAGPVTDLADLAGGVYVRLVPPLS